MSGSLDVTGLKCDVLDAKSMSGSIELHDVTARTARVNSMSGDVTFVGAMPDGNYNFDTMSGDVKLRLNTGSHARIQMVSDNGTATNEGRVTADNRVGRTVGSGVAQVTGHTMSGAVDVTAR